MNASDAYYRENLYPLQNGVLRLAAGSSAPFYLTGGTALTRHYFNHRYSEDLDLFVNGDPGFTDHVRSFFGALREGESRGLWRVDAGRTRTLADFAQFIVRREGSETPVELKIDLVNDVADHFGGFENDPVLGRVDGWRNILSNKLAALPRLEPKDFADLWVIASNRRFLWEEAIDETRRKEAGLSVDLLVSVIAAFPPHAVEAVRWVKPVSAGSFQAALGEIMKDMTGGGANTLCPA